MADDVSMRLQMLGAKLDNVTEELIGMKTDISSIKENTEIRVLNGGNIEVTMKTNELLKHLFEQTKTGGIIDEKFKQCREDHTASKRIGIFDKKSAAWFNVGYRVLVAVAIGYMFLKMMDFENLVSTINHVGK